MQECWFDPTDVCGIFAAVLIAQSLGVQPLRDTIFKQCGLYLAASGKA